MLISSLIAAGSANLHKEAVDWHNRVLTNGGRVSSSTLKAVSNFCYRIDAAGLRDRFARLNLFCGNGLSSCVVPLYRSLSFGGTTYGGTTDINNNFIASDFVETGVGGGLTGFSNKFISPNLTDQTLFSTITNNQDSHMSIYMTRMDNSVTTVMGAMDICNCYVSAMQFGPPSNNYNYIECLMNSDCGNNNYVDGYPVPTSYGLVTASCHSSNINYYNGSSSLLSGSTVPWTASSFGLDIVIMGTSYDFGTFYGCNGGYSYGMDYEGTSCGYSIGKGLSSSQVSDYNTIMTSFQTALGRNV